ncbi:MAG: hypothetical protein MI742_01845 [Desulfobacterales bacterium]|nr:hypothetical protein [Desulfobacterales bacterium]
MNTHVDKTQENKNQSMSNAVTQKSRGESTFEFVDNRPEAIRMQKMQAMANISRQKQKPLQLRMWSISNTASKFQKNPTTIQRIKIKLKDEDPFLMGRLRNVPITNQGAQNLDSLSDISTANQIGSSENIILEGHGYESTSLFSSKIVSQGGIAPSRLAAHAHSVDKPGNWNGNIILAGCSTGDITESVSKEYYKLSGKSVNVIGTKNNIRVGSKADGTNFIGSDWEKYPQSERPADLDFVEDVEKVTKDFWDALKPLIAFTKQLQAFQKAQRTDITLSVAPIEAIASKMVTVETDSSSAKIAHKNYKLVERQQLYAFFTNTIAKLRKIDFFIYPDAVQAKKNPLVEDQQFTSFYQAFLLLSKQGPLYEEISFYLLGLKLKEIDLFDPSQTTHSKKKRTKTSMFGDTWVDD